MASYQAPIGKEIVKQFLYKLVCQLCNTNFEEDIPFACVHFTFCRKCLKEYGLHKRDLGNMVCTRCSGISVSRNEQLDSHQDILSMMFLLAKGRRGLLKKQGNPAVNLLCQQLHDALNVTGTTPCPNDCSTCSLVKLKKEESEALFGSNERRKFGPHGNTVTGPNENYVVIEDNFTCESECVIYFIYCRHPECRKGYVGQTTQRLHDRMLGHRSNITTKANYNLITEHFNSSEHEIKHTIDDVKVCVIKSFPSKSYKDDMLREERALIEHLGTKEFGMNQR